MGTLLAAARPTDRFKSGYKSKNLVQKNLFYKKKKKIFYVLNIIYIPSIQGVCIHYHVNHIFKYFSNVKNSTPI